MQSQVTTDKILIDGCYYVEKLPWGTWQSYDSYGTRLITSFSEPLCKETTRWYLKSKQDSDNVDA